MNNKNSQKNQSKTAKQHTKFKESLHRGTEYLKGAIQSDPNNPTRFICIECQLNIKKDYSGFCENLKGHLKHNQHKNLMKRLNKETECQGSINFLDRTDGSQEASTLSNEGVIDLNPQPVQDVSFQRSQDSTKMKFEIVHFLMKHNLPFSRGPDILELVQSLVKGYTTETILDTKLYSSQMSHIAKDCIASPIQEKYFENLEVSPFSVSIDEGTDKFGLTYLALSARFFETHDSVKPTTRFLGLIEMDDSSTGQVLYEKVTEFLFAKDLSGKIRKNFMGVCSDGAGNMISKGQKKKKELQKGLTNRLSKTFPHIVTVHDYSHVFNLIIKKAIDKFPADIILMIHDICSHFTRSPQKKKKLRKIQRTLGEQKTLDIIRYVETRWFSLKDCVDRILKLKTPLEQYFNKHGTKKQKKYFDHQNILYLQLLSLLLGKLGYYTTFFQGEDIQNNEIINALRESLILIGDLIVKNDDEFASLSKEIRFRNIYDISFDKKAEYEKHLMCIESFAKNLLEEYPVLKESLSQVSENFIKGFFKVAQASLIVSLKTIKNSLPFDEQAIFDSDVAYLQVFDESKWIRLKDKFVNIIPLESHNDFQEQLKRFKYNFAEIRQDTAFYSVGDVWRRNKSKYPLLYELSRALMVIPYSSCSIERIFSHCTDIKTIKRNRLSATTLEACLLLKQESNGQTFNFTPQMFARFQTRNSAERSTNIELPINRREETTDRILGMEVEHDNTATAERAIHRAVAPDIRQSRTQQFLESFFASLEQNFKRELPLDSEYEIIASKKVKADKAGSNPGIVSKRGEMEEEENEDK